MTDRLFVDVHVIQTLPPSCVNRDDMGSPKTAFYGGVTRARVSSQAWKRAVRTEFTQMGEDVGKRTKHMYSLLKNEIEQLDPQIEDVDALTKKVLGWANLSLDTKKTEETKVLVFVSMEQIRALAKFAVAHKDEKKPDKKLEKQYIEECSEALKETPSMDIALFGRMIAEEPSLNFDAAAQVAHAISTHEVHTEFDYFTAVDDCEGAAGAGHLGTSEFNSSTMYRYANVNAMELQRHLGGDTPAVVRAFVEAFVRSMPTGKQNSFANTVRPDAIYVTIRRDQPVNMVGAFEKPVQAGKEGYAGTSIQRLADYAAETYSEYYGAPAWSASVGAQLDKDGRKLPLSELLTQLEAELGSLLAAEEKK